MFGDCLSLLLFKKCVLSRLFSFKMLVTLTFIKLTDILEMVAPWSLSCECLSPVCLLLLLMMTFYYVKIYLFLLQY